MHQFVTIFMLNLLTSIDNAIVIGGIVKRLKNVFAIGVVSAVVITLTRTALIMGVVSVVAMPGLRLSLGIVVLIVAINLANLKRMDNRAGKNRFWRVLIMVVATDLALSVDNILSIAILSKNVSIIATSVFLSLLPLLLLLPTIVRVMDQVLWLRILAAGFVAELAIDSITDDPWVIRRIPSNHVEWLLRASSAAVVIVYGFWRARAGLTRD